MRDELLKKFSELVNLEGYPAGLYLSQLIKKFMEENPEAEEYFSAKRLKELTEVWFTETWFN